MRSRRNMITKMGGVLLLACAAFLWNGATTQAEAAFVLHICDDAACSGAGDIAIADGAAGDLSGAAGVIIASEGGVGGFSAVTVETAFSKPFHGTAAEPELDLSFQASSAGAGSKEVWIYATDTGYTGITPLHLEIGGTTEGTVDAAAFGGTSDIGRDLANPIGGALGPFSGGAFSGTGTSELVGSGANPYSLTLLVHIVHGGGASKLTTGDAHLIGPEPASLMLFGLGLAGLGIAGRRRRQSMQQ